MDAQSRFLDRFSGRKPLARRWTVILGMAGALYLAGNVFQPTVVVGKSMAPTLDNGKVIWVDRTYYRFHKPQRGEVVVFKHKGETYVKRVYRGPGEEVDFLATRGEWLSPIRESRLAEIKARYSRSRTGIRVHQMIVPDDRVFVLGDNYLASEDSRELGPIPISSIVGRAYVEVDMTKALPWEAVPKPKRWVPTSAPGGTSVQAGARGFTPPPATLRRRHFQMDPQMRRRMMEYFRKHMNAPPQKVASR
jgi:signal peptidase I